MRQLADFSDSFAAERFAGYLTSQGIESEVRESSPDTYRLWVHDEDKLPEARSILREYLADPEAPKFRVKPKPLPTTDRAEHIDVRPHLFGRPAGSSPSVTLALIVTSVVLTLLSFSPEFQSFTLKLYYSEYLSRDFREIASGQVWRLVTPIFLHGGWLHLIFNMLWLWQLGGAIEVLESSRKLILLVLVAAILCNTGQYLVSGPRFIGMSGVVYAVLGYVWMMGRHKPTSGYVLQHQIVVFMLIWLVICLVGIIPNVANTQHVLGLAIGTVWGFVQAGGPGAAIRKRRWKSKIQ